MEAIANGIEDRLIDGLSFKLAPGASYITERKSVTYNCQGSNIYSPTSGNTLIRFLLTGDQWADPSTLRIMFDVYNNAASGSGQMLRPLGAPWAFLRRVRVLCGNTLVEDMDNYARIHKMFHNLTSKHS